MRFFRSVVVFVGPASWGRAGEPVHASVDPGTTYRRAADATSSWERCHQTQSSREGETVRRGSRQGVWRGAGERKGCARCQKLYSIVCSSVWQCFTALVTYMCMVGFCLIYMLINLVSIQVRPSLQWRTTCDCCSRYVACRMACLSPSQWHKTAKTLALWS